MLASLIQFCAILKELKSRCICDAPILGGLFYFYHCKKSVVT